MAENKRQKHKCPPIPEGFDRQFTGPSWQGEPQGSAQRAWAAHLRKVQRLVPMPRTTR